ncbi:hypothetical protein [Anaeromicropila populeti]|uniref:Uncharacterized protein n=1 Tax=Anaeromicropila populeti TaxID=37658 RepID=A0A1I6JQH6_9FIRM|nr:hypothetical protein [Anaeromicropila populeti]SFR80780.1 hypothetical protein SAMN05661086_01830 [Anaeromicropila populeti]
MDFKIINILFPNKKVPKDLRELYVWKQIIAEYEDNIVTRMRTKESAFWATAFLDLICCILYCIFLRNNRILQLVICIVFLTLLIIYKKHFDLSRNVSFGEMRKYRIIVAIEVMIHVAVLAHSLYLGINLADKNLLSTDFIREFVSIYIGAFVIVILFYRLLRTYFVRISYLADNPLSKPARFGLIGVLLSRWLVRANIINDKTIVWVMIFTFIAMSITISYRVFIYRHLYLIYKKEN